METMSQQRDAFVDRVFQSIGGFFDVFTMYLGDRLGFYETLAAAGPLTPPELAARTGTHERYVREWLEQQTVAGFLRVDDPAQPARERRYTLPPAHREVLADRDSLYYLAPQAQLLNGAVRPIDQLLRAFRTGDGVDYREYGPDLREGQSRNNRVMFLKQLSQEWLAAMPDVLARLHADPPARVAELGCGGGYAAIGMARHFPKIAIDGFDLDAPSVEMARRNAAEAGLSARVRFHVRDAGDPALAGQYDLVTAFECVHDMGRPVEALQSMRRLAREGGAVLVADERVGETFTGRSEDGFERMMYGWSVLHCLPSGMCEHESAGTGAVMRPHTLREYAMEAGFRDVETLPVDHAFFRFYRLHA
ncbi:MAG: methyltransferase domain-containing protein [Bryobacterales bacterium]|nr:methyltransferase domain-containing protein [Bryobacterales bacterium]